MDCDVVIDPLGLHAIDEARGHAVERPGIVGIENRRDLLGAFLGLFLGRVGGGWGRGS